MKRIIYTAAVALALTPAPAFAQTIVVPKPTPHHHHARGFLYFSEARLLTVRVVRKYVAHRPAEYGTYVIGACHRRGRLAVNCDVARHRTEADGVGTVCAFVSRVRKHVRADRSTAWSTRLDLAGTGCRLDTTASS